MLALIALTVVAATVALTVADLCLEAAAWGRACRDARRTLAECREGKGR